MKSIGSILTFLNELKNKYSGDITLNDLIKKVEKIKDKQEEIYYSTFLNLKRTRIYISSNKKDWNYIPCNNIIDAEQKIKELIEQDKNNGINSVYIKEIVRR